MTYLEMYCGDDKETIQRLKIKQAVYNAHCATFKIACRIANTFGNVTKSSNIIASSMKAPHCLRIVKAYRDENTQSFRDFVAKEVKKLRAQR